MLQKRNLDLVVTVLLITTFIAVGCNTPRQINSPDEPADNDISRTLDSLQLVDDHPLYTMTYYGDYGFDVAPHADSATVRRAIDGTFPGHSCSTIVVRNEQGEVLIGRNFDWIHRAALLLYTDSPTGYASVSMVDIAYMGFEDSVPEDVDKTALLETPFWPMDGLNEHGLAVSQMAVPDADLDFAPGQPTLGSLEVIRYLLDHATTVPEALDLMKGINIDWEGGPTLHYLVADATGESALVEFVDGELVITREQVPWQIATNFTQYGTSPSNRENICTRYGAAEDILLPANGQISQAALIDLMSDLSSNSGSSKTMWTVVYNLTTGEIDIVMGRDYEDVDTFSLNLTR